MRRTYQALLARARNLLLPNWATDAPTPPYNQYPPSLTPHPFMGLGKFVAARIHQMRAAKRYRAAHPSWFDENPNLTCPAAEPNQKPSSMPSLPARLEQGTKTSY